MKSIVFLVFFVILFGMCTEKNETRIPVIDINMSIDGAVYHVHVDQNSTDDAIWAWKTVSELLVRLNKG